MKSCNSVAISSRSTNDESKTLNVDFGESNEWKQSACIAKINSYSKKISHLISTRQNKN